MGEWAFQRVYDFESQGDNLLLARENLFATFIEVYREQLGKLLFPRQMNVIANIIAWNLWQMDGTKYVVPCNGEVGAAPSKGYKAVPQIELPGEVNTFSYLVLGTFDAEEEIKNYKKYLICKFTRFMLRLTYSSMHITRANFVFVPDQDFT